MTSNSSGKRMDPPGSGGAYCGLDLPGRQEVGLQVGLQPDSGPRTRLNNTSAIATSTPTPTTNTVHSTTSLAGVCFGSGFSASAPPSVRGAPTTPLLTSFARSFAATSASNASQPLAGELSVRRLPNASVNGLLPCARN